MPYRKKIGSKHVLVLYGAAGETHETAFAYKGKAPAIKVADRKSLTKTQAKDGSLILNYVTTGQTVVEVGDDLLLFLVDRNTAYRFWVPDVPADKAVPGPAFSTKESVIIKGTYLIRSIDINGSTLKIRGDINTTETIEIVAGDNVKKVKFNGDDLKVDKSSYGTLLGKLVYNKPKVALPTLSKLTWVCTFLCCYFRLGDRLTIGACRNMPTVSQRLVRSMTTANGPMPTRKT